MHDFMTNSCVRWLYKTMAINEMFFILCTEWNAFQKMLNWFEKQTNFFSSLLCSVMLKCVCKYAFVNKKIIGF